MDFVFCLLPELQQLLLPLEIDFALGLVLRGYLMNLGYLGKRDKGQASLGSEDKNLLKQESERIALMQTDPQ